MGVGETRGSIRQGGFAQVGDRGVPRDFRCGTSDIPWLSAGHEAMQKGVCGLYHGPDDHGSRIIC